ncbi:VOC family protein [Streptomyces lasiicapitis]|uniref:hypothetical protein n=1 Tax=Streptomyces lasiicapitis TaxID=1923961 RepID=UPI00365CB7BD
MSAPTTVQWFRNAGTRVYTGSGRLVVHGARRVLAWVRRLYERIRAWLSKSSGWRWCAKVAALLVAAALTRQIAMAVLSGMYVRIESGAWSWTLWAAAIAWLVAAYRSGRPGWTPKERPVSTGDGAEQPAPDAGPSLPSLQDLRESLARVGTPHAHIAVLAADLGTTHDRVREALDQHGVAVEPVRMRGRGSSTGIKGNALPTRTPPPGGVVGAGQPANNNTNNAPTAPFREGFRVQGIGQGGRIVTDPAETTRHHHTEK